MSEQTAIRVKKKGRVNSSRKQSRCTILNVKKVGFELILPVTYGSAVNAPRVSRPAGSRRNSLRQRNQRTQRNRVAAISSMNTEASPDTATNTQHSSPGSYQRVADDLFLAAALHYTANYRAQVELMSLMPAMVALLAPWPCAFPLVADRLPPLF